VDLNANISATAFDLGPNTFFGNDTQYGNETPNNRYDPNMNFGGNGEWANQTEMWYLPTGPAFFQNSDQAITQTAEGVNVGGFDLLEYMAMDPMDPFPEMNANGMGPGF
jgi:hypothetical protein